MWKQLFYKWFGLELPVCESCEILREQLAKSERERMELLHRLLDSGKTEPLPQIEEVQTPIQPQFTPWRVRQQMLEVEDRKTAQLMREKQKEMQESKIAELERELDIPEVRVR